jgi:hypothetical protein
MLPGCSNRREDVQEGPGPDKPKHPETFLPCATVCCLERPTAITKSTIYDEVHAAVQLPSGRPDDLPLGHAVTGSTPAPQIVWPDRLNFKPATLIFKSTWLSSLVERVSQATNNQRSPSQLDLREVGN